MSDEGIRRMARCQCGAADTLRSIAAAIGAADQLPRWSALSGRIPDDIERAILAAPERWNDLRAWLAGERGSRG